MSIADRLRAEQAERLRHLDATARVELALALGRRDVALYAAAHAVTADEARLKLRAQLAYVDTRLSSLPERCQELWRQLRSSSDDSGQGGGSR